LDKPQNLAEYSEWAKKELSVDLESTASKDLYNFNAQEAYNAIIGHEFVKGIDAQLAKWTAAYVDCTGSDLFMENTRLELIQKSYDSAINKSFRKNIFANEHFPDPPQDGGWVEVKNLPERINDSVRGILVCRFIDGARFCY
jgi:hypothetical protein